MIPYPRSESSTPSALTIRIIGLGNAGVHLADRMAMAGAAGADVMVMNTDAQSLASSVAPLKISLGQKVTRGLGTGGDPEVGYDAAEESREEIRRAVEGAGLVFLCAGLGGGTGSGIAPVVAEIARESGATVFSLVTSPFAFEGRRRAAQSAVALTALARHSDALIHFENDRMAELTAPRSGIEETFAASDTTLINCIISLIEILRGGAPMPVGLADLLAAVGGGSAHTLFGRGEATGENRAHEALERALKSPLLDRGRLLDESHAVIAHLSGPPSLSFAEVAAIMRELTKHIADDAGLFLGVTTTPNQSAPVSVTILGNYATGLEAPALPVAPPQVRAEPKKRPAPAPPEPVTEKDATPEEEPNPLFPESPVPEEKPALAARPVPREPKPAPKPAPQPKVKQETLQFESVARGRFEKSEPTIVEGEDLDVPTFLRMRGKTK